MNDCVVDPRLGKLAKLIALHDDKAATEGERANCRLIGKRLSAEIGIEFSRDAIETARFSVSFGHTSSDYEYAVKEAREEIRRANEREAQEYLRKCRENRSTGARKAAETRKARTAERKTEHARQDRIKAGLEAPTWDDLRSDHLEWLDRIAALDLSNDDFGFVKRMRTDVRNGCLGAYGTTSMRINTLIARAFLEQASQ
jgi:hypothetical protein